MAAATVPRRSTRPPVKFAGTIELGGGPEFAVADGAGSVFVNLEDKNEVLRLDARELSVKNRWPLAPCAAPSSMAIDRKNHRLFIGCRSHVMAVVNAENGRVIATLPIGDHVDASAFDPETGLVFNSTGAGTVEVFSTRIRRTTTQLRRESRLMRDRKRWRWMQRLTKSLYPPMTREASTFSYSGSKALVRRPTVFV